MKKFKSEFTVLDGIRWCELNEVVWEYDSELSPAKLSASVLLKEIQHIGPHVVDRVSIHSDGGTGVLSDAMFRLSIQELLYYANSAGVLGAFDLPWSDFSVSSSTSCGVITVRNVGGDTYSSYKKSPSEEWEFIRSDALGEDWYPNVIGAMYGTLRGCYGFDGIDFMCVDRDDVSDELLRAPGLMFFKRMRDIVDEVLCENQKCVNDFLAGNDKALHRLIGIVLQRERRLDPEYVRELLDERIKLNRAVDMWRCEDNDDV